MGIPQKMDDDTTYETVWKRIVWLSLDLYLSGPFHVEMPAIGAAHLRIKIKPSNSGNKCWIIKSTSGF